MPEQSQRFWDLVNTPFYEHCRPPIYRRCRKLVLELNARPARPDKSKISFDRAGGGAGNRLQLAVRRFLTRVLKLNSAGLSDSVLDSLAVQIQALLNCTGAEFYLLKGEEITQAYDDSIGGSSCMTGEDADKTELYALNPDRIRLITVEVGHSSARALLWKTDQGPLVIDRIYRDSEQCKQLIVELAKDWGITSIYGGAVDTYTVSGLKWNNGCCPYMDSFTTGIKYDDGSIKIATSPITSEYKSTQTQCGAYDFGDVLARCCQCNQMLFDECEIRNVDDVHLCERCFIEMPNCGVCGRQRRRGLMTQTRRHGPVCLSCLSAFTACSRCGVRTMTAEMTKVELLTVCRECVTRYPTCSGCNNKAERLTPNELCITCDSEYHLCSTCQAITPVKQVLCDTCTEVAARLDDRAFPTSPTDWYDDNCTCSDCTHIRAIGSSLAEFRERHALGESPIVARQSVSRWRAVY